MNVHECTIKVHDFMNKFSPGKQRLLDLYKLGDLYSGGLYSGGLIFGGGGLYIWNDVSVSTSGGGLIHGGAYIRGGG